MGLPRYCHHHLYTSGGSTPPFILPFSPRRKISRPPLYFRSKTILPYQQRYEKCRLIIADEVSMISKCFLACINTRLQQIKGNEQLPYGGINMLFVGDFYQLRPVQGASLTIEDSSPGNNPIFENIFQVSYVFELKQQMRAR